MLDHMDDLLQTQCPSMVDATAKYSDEVSRTTEESFAPRLAALIRLGIGMSIPNQDMARQALRDARKVASDGEIAEVVFAACELKAGAATAYGRLAFKYTDPNPPKSESHDPAQDRAYMAQFRKASPKAFASLMHRIGVAHSHDSRLSTKEYELIAVACATTSRCVYCIEKHSRDAKEAGATDRDLADVVHMVIESRIEATLREWKAIEAE